MSNEFTVDLADKFIKALIEVLEISNNVKISYKLEKISKYEDNKKSMSCCERHTSK